MIAIVSAILLAMVESNETVVAMAFISMSISYIVIALLSNSSVIQKITKLPETKKDANLITRFLLSFRITIVPILLAAVLLGLLWTSTGGDSNKWISPVLASLFIVWSIAQAASFRAGIVEWLANGLGDAKPHIQREGFDRLSSNCCAIICSDCNLDRTGC